MKKFTQTILLLFIVFSCAKKTVNNPPTECPTVVQPDNIIYKNIQPNIVLNSISSTSLHSAGFYVNLPVDTICSDSIKQIDFPDATFTFLAGNYYQWKSNSSPSYNYFSYIKMGPWLASDSMIVKTINGPLACNKEFNLGDTIRQDNNHFSRSSSINSFEFGYSCYSGIGDHYYGFKIYRNSETYFGWMKIERFGVNGIKVKEIAINKTNGKLIVCGQTQ